MFCAYCDLGSVSCVWDVLGEMIYLRISCSIRWLMTWMIWSWCLETLIYKMDKWLVSDVCVFVGIVVVVCMCSVHSSGCVECFVCVEGIGCSHFCVCVMKSMFSFVCSKLGYDLFFFFLESDDE